MNGVLQFSVFSEGIVVKTLGYPFLSSQNHQMVSMIFHRASEVTNTPV